MLCSRLLKEHVFLDSSYDSSIYPFAKKQHVEEDECGGCVEWFWQGRTDLLGEKPISLLLRLPETRMSWPVIEPGSQLWSRRLTASSMASLCSPTHIQTPHTHTHTYVCVCVCVTAFPSNIKKENFWTDCENMKHVDTLCGKMHNFLTWPQLA